MAVKLRQLKQSSHHYHYYYTLRYNNVLKKVDEIRKCSTKHQSGLLYSGSEHCIFALQTPNIKKKASTVCKEYLAPRVPLSSMVGTDTATNIHQFADKLFRKEDLEEVFARKVCSTHSVNLTLDQVYGELCLKAKDEGQVMLGLADIQVMLSTIKCGIANKEREVTDERPYTKWLYNYVDDVLDTTSYIVESPEENLPKLLETYNSEEINEYSTSRADLVIQKVQDNPIL